MKTQLTDAEKSTLLPQIAEVLQGNNTRWENESLHYPVEAIVNAILSLPGVKRAELDDPRYGIEGFDTNGWQWDWWQYFEHDGKRYVLSGSGYYGGHTFGLEDEP